MGLAVPNMDLGRLYTVEQNQAKTDRADKNKQGQHRDYVALQYLLDACNNQ